MLFNSVMRGGALPAVKVGGLEAVRDQHGYRSIGIEFWLSLVGSTLFFALFFSRLPFLTAYTDELRVPELGTEATALHRLLYWFPTGKK